MSGKVLIVEDEPIVALDLQQELEEFGCEVTWLAESADAALMSVEECRPDLVLMDISIEGSMDGIQTARLLRHAYEVPVVFLTSYSDKETLARAARELPYGYLTKPFRSRELHATLSVALHKAAVDAELRKSSKLMSMTIQGVREAIVLVAPDGTIQYMNKAAEQMTGLSSLRARGMLLNEVFQLEDICERSIPMPVLRGQEISLEEFGWLLHVPGKDRLIVDYSVRSLINEVGDHGGHVLALRDATERMRQKMIEASLVEAHTFDNSAISMVQLDGSGRVMRINQRFLEESSVPTESVVGRRLTDLLADPDPLISSQFVRRLVQTLRPPHRAFAR
jgi:PAS domain S-box-containing protein